MLYNVGIYCYIGVVIYRSYISVIIWWCVRI